MNRTLMRARNGARPGMALVGALAVLLTLTGCGGGDSSSSSGGTVLLGNEATLTGGGASTGIPQSNGIELAVDEINAAGGFEVDGKKYKIDLDTFDDKSDATAGVQGVQRLLTKGAKYMVGTVSSSVLQAYVPVIEDNDDFVAVVVGASVVGANKNKQIYRPRVTLDQYTTSLVEFMGQKATKKLAILTDSQHAGFVGETDHLKKTLAEAGIELVGEETYKLGDTDFSAQLTAILKDNPEGINVRGYAADIARVIKQARELGYKGPMYSSSGITATEVEDAQAAKEMENSFDVIAPVAQDLATGPEPEAAEAFLKAYQDKFGEPAGFTSASAYTGVYILVAAMQKAGTVDDVPAVRDALDALKVTDVEKVVDAIVPQGDGLIFAEHQGYYRMVVRAWDGSTFAFQSFLS